MRIESLTFFRFVAAFIVVVFHFGLDSGLPEIFGKVISSGSQMVTFFFVLSGFVMMVSHYHKVDGSLFVYYLSRVARIAPVYLLALALSAVFVSYSDITGLLLSVTLIQAWFPPYPLEPNVPGWSLSVEAFFYLSFPLLLLIINRYKPGTLSCFLWALLIYGATQWALSAVLMSGFYQGEPSVSHDLIYFFPLSHFCSFMMGIAGGILYVRHLKLFNRKGVWPLMVFLGVAFLSGYLLNHPDFLSGLSPYSLVLGASFYAPVFLLFILSVAGSQNLITHTISSRFFVFLGEISYCMYIMQFPVNRVYDKFLTVYFEFHPMVDFFAFMVLLMLVSMFVYRYFEQPCRVIIMKQGVAVANKFRQLPLNIPLRPCVQ